jgi:DUF1365 family protein
LSSTCLYHCKLSHERLVPRHHKFAYGLFMLYLDLDNLQELEPLKSLSVNRSNIFSFFESDHLKQNLLQGEADLGRVAAIGSPSLAHKIRQLAQDEGLLEPVSRITLLTLPRIFNYVFNPVSFYFLFAENKTALACVVEVSNTFREMKTYFMRAPREAMQSSACVFNMTVPKHFYVSPFGELADCFDFIVPVPDERLAVVINTVRDGDISRKIMCANLSGTSAALTNFSLVLNLVRYPLLTFKVMAMIHWQAFVLFLKKVPFHAKEDKPALQIDVFNRRKEKANG